MREKEIQLDRGLTDRQTSTAHAHWEIPRNPVADQSKTVFVGAVDSQVVSSMLDYHVPCE